MLGWELGFLDTQLLQLVQRPRSLLLSVGCVFVIDQPHGRREVPARCRDDVDYQRHDGPEEGDVAGVALPGDYRAVAEFPGEVDDVDDRACCERVLQKGNEGCTAAGEVEHAVRKSGVALLKVLSGIVVGEEAGNVDRGVGYGE